MYSLILLGSSAFLLSLILTPMCRNVFRRRGIVGQPSDTRRSDGVPIPRAGGIALILSIVGSCAILLVSPVQDHWIRQFSLILCMLPAAGILFAVGLVDDLWGLRPVQKLAGQIVAAGLAYWTGIRFMSVGGFVIEYQWLSLLFTVGWLILCSNSFNLIDGVDGLASGLGLFASITTVAVALLGNNNQLAIAAMPLTGALFGFLCYNFNPATIFLGDSGSLLIGFLLGCYGLTWSQQSATVLGITAPVMALGIPLLDVALTVARRTLRGQPIFLADRRHIHHRLLDRGMTPRQVVGTLYAFSGLFAAFSLISTVETE